MVSSSQRGLYGVIAYVVSKRTREIGMRLAIGAQPGEVLRSVVGRTLALVAMGLLLGIPLAASWLPRRAASVDPIAALRVE